MNRVFLLVWTAFSLALATATARAEEQLRVRISWGHQTAVATPFAFKLLAADATVSEPTGRELEPGESASSSEWLTRAGGGDVDAAEFTLRFPERQITVITNLQRIWADLVAQSDAETARRLRDDPAYRPDSRILTVQMDASGTKGFSVTVDQLLRQKAFWVPSLDVFIAAGDQPLSWAAHRREILEGNPRRVLDQVQNDPDANYEQFTARWEDMGDAGYKNPAQTGPGHIVGITWDSALYKFGIDRGAGVWNDYGNPDRFHVWFDFGELAQDLSESWKGQRLSNGLPVITTRFEKDGIEREIEQFAYPLNGPPGTRQGDIPMVLFAKLRLTNPSARTEAG